MLTTPQARTPLHTREISFNGYARDDGLWDIEGHLKDTKSHLFTTEVELGLLAKRFMTCGFG
jgi:hypothetical protein